MVAILALGFTVMVAVVGGEAYLRMKDRAWLQKRDSAIPGLPYEFVPNQKVRSRSAEYRINAYGWRGPDFPVEKPPGENRILFLGDSIVQGAFVSEEDCVAGRLESLWRASSGHETTRVINAGVSSYDLLAYVALYRGRAREFDPDAVVIGITMNDHQSFLPQSQAGFARKPRIWERSRLYNYLTRGFLRHETGGWRLDGERPDDESGDLGAVPFHDTDPESAAALVQFASRKGYPLGQIADQYFRTLYDMDAWSHIREPLAEMRDLVRADGASLLVAIFPLEFQIEPAYTYDQPQRLIRDICEELGIPVVDATPILRELQESSGTGVFEVRSDVIHFNAAAHDATATAIFETQTALAAASTVPTAVEQSSQD